MAKAQGYFEGLRQYILSCESPEKTTPKQIPNQTLWPKKVLPTNMTKVIFDPLDNFGGTLILYYQGSGNRISQKDLNHRTVYNQ